MRPNAHDVPAAAVTGFMSLALSGSGGAGSVAPLIWKLWEKVEITPFGFSCTHRYWWDWHFPSLVLGILIGVILGPLLEAICCLRLAVSRYWLQRLQAAAPPAGRVKPLFRRL